MPNKIKLTVYTDGGCSPNPGRGAFAAIILQDGKEIHRLVGGKRQTTNNEMELMAPIKALIWILNSFDNADITIHADSQYVINSMTKWAAGWEKKRWAGIKNATHQKNLWLLCKELKPRWIWVKAHNGNFYNELCDQLATEARNNCIWELLA